MTFYFLWLLIIVCAVPATAQFQSLAPSGDGSRLFFSSERRQAGTDQPFHAKIFEISSTGALRLAAWQPFSAIGPSGSSVVPYRYSRVSISDDAAVALITRQGDCQGEACLSVGPSTVMLRNGVESPLQSGTCTVSRNGRFAVCSETLPTYSKFAVLSDLETRASRATPSGITITSRPADNGTVCLSDGRVQDTQGRVATLDLPGLVTCADLDATAAIFAVNSEGRVWILDSRTGRTVPLGTPYEVRGIRLSADGGTAVFTMNAKLAAWTAGTGETRVYETPWPIQDVAVAGAAPIAWATTTDGRILRVDLKTGAVQDLTGPTPVATPATPSPVGSAVTFRAEAGTLDGLSVRLDGSSSDLPEIRRTPGELIVQIPWESPAGASLSIVSASGTASLFDPGFTFRWKTRAATDRDGAFFFEPAFHQDWRGPTSYADPAVPGEYVHVYAIGLGPVTPAVATGEPGPSNPPAVVTGDFRCSMEFRNTYVDTWAGLAPGLVGYYQVTVRVPEETGLVIPYHRRFSCTRGSFEVFIQP